MHLELALLTWEAGNGEKNRPPPAKSHNVASPFLRPLTAGMFLSLSIVAKVPCVIVIGLGIPMCESARSLKRAQQ